MPEAQSTHKRPPLPEPLPRPAIDSHCHIDMRGQDEEALSPAQAASSAGSVNVTGIVQVGCSIRDLTTAVAMAEEHPHIVAAIGIHPNEAPRLAARGELDAALAAYAAALRLIFPARVVQAGLLYTSTPQLFVLPDSLLASVKLDP